MREKELTLYDYDTRLDNIIQRIEGKTISVHTGTFGPYKLSGKNKAVLLRYKDSLFNDGLSKPRMIRVLATTARLVELLGKDLGSEDKRDIERVLSAITQNEAYAPATVQQYKVSTKRFWKWLEGEGEEYPKKVSWIKCNLKRTDKKLPRDLLTEEEIMQLINCSNNLRDRALISVLYETGGRISEIGTAKVGAVSFFDGEGEIMLRGKTGERKVLLLSSVPYMRAWLRVHPAKESERFKEAALFCGIGTAKYGEPIGYESIFKVLQKAAKRAELGKRITPHLFRHSRASSLANKLTEAQLCAVFGWQIGSDMPATYVHLSGRDVNFALRAAAGVVKPKEQKDSLLKPIKCGICSEVNEPGTEVCARCHNALTVEAAAKNRASITTELQETKAMLTVVKRLVGCQSEKEVRERLLAVCRG